MAEAKSYCLKCATWDNGKGLGALYQYGLKDAIQRIEYIYSNIEDKALVRQLFIVDQLLHDVDECISGFQGELGLIEEIEEEITESTKTD